MTAADQYLFEVIAEGGNFKKPLISQRDNSQVTIIKGLQFKKKYQWRVQAFDEEEKLISETPVYHFSIGTSPKIDTTQRRFNLIKSMPGEYQDGFIFLDYSGVAINRKGIPVWFLPEMPAMNINRDRLRDLKFTPYGTITFNAMSLCREISLDGETLWETPGDGGLVSKTDREFYHHEFSRLQSGNYMVLGKSLKEKELELGDQKVDKIPLSVIIEYNRNRDTVWTWNSDNYVQDSDLLTLGKKVFMGNTFGHMNSFIADENKNEIYACFRDLNAIIVIDKRTGKVIRSYGDKIPSDKTSQAIGFFRKQHAPVLMPDGQILIFNNNDRQIDTVSKITMITQPKSISDKSIISWEFDCNFDTIMSGFADRMGNVQPLDENHFLVNMGTVARLFEVTRDKRVIWDCLPEKWNPEMKKWDPSPNYRLSFTESLYPCYFSISLRKNAALSSSLRVVNEGTRADQYTIQIKSVKKPKKIITYHSGWQQPDSSFILPLDQISGKKAYRDGIIVEVKSAVNSQLLRTSTYSIP